MLPKKLSDDILLSEFCELLIEVELNESKRKRDEEKRNKLYDREIRELRRVKNEYQTLIDQLNNMQSGGA